ncbi:MAG: Maf-like protein R00002 [Rhodomicrobium sp.]|nr:MAG: Maf-like protein R00002 [Rhodomicrobium sp.]
MFKSEKSRLVLASGSHTRATLLEKTGLSFEIDPPHIDEPSIRKVFEAEDTDPADIAEILAEAKAMDISKSRADQIIIGSDQILALGDEIIEKPTNKDEAHASLFKLRGKTHKLISAVVIVKNNNVIWRHSDTAELTMRDFSPEFLGEYLAHSGDTIYKSPGSYQIENFGIHLFEEIKGDYFTILGFPLLPLLGYLRQENLIRS